MTGVKGVTGGGRVPDVAHLLVREAEVGAELVVVGDDFPVLLVHGDADVHDLLVVDVDELFPGGVVVGEIEDVLLRADEVREVEVALDLALEEAEQADVGLRLVLVVEAERFLLAGLDQRDQLLVELQDVLRALEGLLDGLHALDLVVEAAEDELPDLALVVVDLDVLADHSDGVLEAGGLDPLLGRLVEVLPDVQEHVVGDELDGEVELLALVV